MDIDIHAMTDRELLIMAVGKLNGVCSKTEQFDKDINGNGKMGIKSQVRILWILACGLWAVALVVIREAVAK